MTKTKNKPLLFILFAMSVYMFLKIYRNSLDGDSTTQGGIWNIINALFIFLAVCIVFFAKLNFARLPGCIGFAYLYSGLALLFSLMNFKVFSISTLFSLAMILYFPSVMFVFYIYSLRGTGQSEKRFLMISFYAVAIFCLYLMILRIQGQGEIYQSDMYFLLCLLPMVFLYRRKSRLYIPLIIVSAVVILSAKRTAALGLAGAILAFFFVQSLLQRNVKVFLKNFLRILFIVLVLTIVYQYLASQYDITLLERLGNLEEDGGSGRDDIYRNLWTAIKEAPIIRWFIGYGDKAVLRVYGRTSAAHNDFLEIMYDYGIFPLLAIIVFYFSMIKECLKMVVARFWGAPAFAAGLVISLFMSMFSNYMITFTHITGMAAFWGICLAEWKKYQSDCAFLREGQNGEPNPRRRYYGMRV